MQIAYKLIACRTPEKLLSLSVAAYIPLDKKNTHKGTAEVGKGGGGAVESLKNNCEKTREEIVGVGAHV